jgi:selenocysteine-specific elongation factor
MNGSGGIVVGTAGHIDHGKTTLVRALTGIDTDRLAEEKKRGISIELGFAHLILPNQQRIAIIDVPGHEGFIKNMLAGAGGIDAVVLVVAADEGVKPQTREHLEICRLLGISKGLVVLTKSDLASDDQLDLVRAEVSEICAGTFLEGAPVVAVSAYTGSGLDELVAEFVRLSRSLQPRPAGNAPRLPVDRSFTLQGFGTVITGTLLSGSFRSGDIVEIHPLRERVRVRGIQVHNQSVQAAAAGERTALNLAGIDAQRIERGSVVVRPDTFDSTQIFDATVEWLDPKFASRTRQTLQLYLGCAESTADVRLISALGPKKTLTRVSSRVSLIALPGDRFVLRNSETTVGGGGILDPFPPVRLNREKTKTRLERLRAGGDQIRLAILIDESTQGRKIANLARLTGWSEEKIRELVKQDPNLTICDVEQRVVSLPWLKQKQQQVVAWLDNFHTAHPGVAGAPIHQVRSALMSGLEQSITEFILKDIPQTRISGDTISLVSHTARLNPQETKARSVIEKVYSAAALQPPALQEALAQSGVNGATARSQLEALVKEKKLIRVASELIFHADVLKEVKVSLQRRKGQRFSVPEFKEWTGISRKYAIPLLEYLDREHVTRRDGDARLVL